MSSNSLNLFDFRSGGSSTEASLHGPKCLPLQNWLLEWPLEGAKAIGLENKIGSLERGKLADVIIIEQKALI